MTYLCMCTTLVGIIPVNVGQNPMSASRGEVFIKKLLTHERTDGRTDARTMDDGQMGYHKSSHCPLCAQVS